MESVLRALADQSRRTMLDTLAGGPATVGELAALLPIARPGVSRHLRVLREAGLVEVRQEAQRRGYNPPPPPPAAIDQRLGRDPGPSGQRPGPPPPQRNPGQPGRRSTTRPANHAPAPPPRATSQPTAGHAPGPRED